MTHAPGKHPVQDETGLGLWGKGSKAYHDGEDGAGRKPVPKLSPLGRLEYEPLNSTHKDFNPFNPRWRYIKLSMYFTALRQPASGMQEYGGPRQFHDRHPKYSSFVLEQLEKMAMHLEKKLTKKSGMACSKCTEKASSATVPPPYPLLDRLNELSERLAQVLKSSVEHKKLFTSSWCNSAAKDADPDADRKACTQLRF